MAWEAIAPELIDAFIGSSAVAGAGEATGAFDMFGSQAIPGVAESGTVFDGATGLAPTQMAATATGPGATVEDPGMFSGQYDPMRQAIDTAGGAPGAGGPSSWWDKMIGGADSAADWMEKHKMATMMGLGLGLGGLNAYGSAQAAKRNQEFQRQALADQKARQAQQDYPAPYSGMNIGPPTQSDYSRTAVMNPLALRNYGAGPEARFFNASGGLPAHHRAHSGAFDLLSHEGGGQEDNVPAMLSPKEYVLDADVVSALGDGNPDHGAKKLDAFREKIRAHKRGAPSSRIPPKARPLESYMRGAA